MRKSKLLLLAVAMSAAYLGGRGQQRGSTNNRTLRVAVKGLMTAIWIDFVAPHTPRIYSYWITAMFFAFGSPERQKENRTLQL